MNVMFWLWEMQSLIDEFWNLWDIYLCNETTGTILIWSKRTIALVICRYRSNIFKVTEFSQSSYLEYNAELRNKAANSLPESGGSPKILERALLHVKVLHQ